MDDLNILEIPADRLKEVGRNLLICINILIELRHKI